MQMFHLLLKEAALEASHMLKETMLCMSMFQVAFPY